MSAMVCKCGHSEQWHDLDRTAVPAFRLKCTYPECRCEDADFNDKTEEK